MSRSTDPGTKMSVPKAAFAKGAPAASKVGKKVYEKCTAETPSTHRQKSSFIQVIARVRPRLASEQNEPEAVEVPLDGKTILLGDGNNRKQYAVDRVFDSRNDQGRQDKLFDHSVRGLVTESVKGYNICIFAYGHTGSGKTYTMLGDGGFVPNVTGSEAGILPRFLHSVFQAHARDHVNETGSGWGYTCEFFEVYNEQINDLLYADDQNKKPLRKGGKGLHVHVHPKHGVRVENVTSSVVTSAEEALGLVQFGNQMRTVAATTMNERSSRGHAIFTFRFEPLDAQASSPNHHNGDGNRCQSTITFVDLAGKEEKLASHNKAMQFREMCYINTSLFHLAHLITKLAEGTGSKDNWSDFRNSKLTLLLSHALVGNSRTALIATLAPLKSYYEDSASTLNFAQSVKKIKTKPTVNNKPSKYVLTELEAEVRMLQKELNESKTSNWDKEQELLTAQALINHYKGSWQEAVARSEALKENRKSVIERTGLLDPTALGHSLPVSNNGDILPFLTKLCDDPSLQGCCNFFLNKNDLRIGSDEDCDIVLQGVGITEEMCELQCNSDGTVEVEILENGALSWNPGDAVPRVLVRGKPLCPDNNPTATLRHSDCIILGYAHAFRLVAPTKEMLENKFGMDTRDQVRATITELDMVSALAEIVDETGAEFKSIYPYVKNLSNKLPESHLQSLLQSLHCMCPLIDEANVITQEVWREFGIRFELRALTNIFDIENDMPTLVVCVLKQFDPDASTAPASPARGMSSPDRGKEHPIPTDTSFQLPPTPGGRRPRRASMAFALGLTDNLKMGERDSLSYVWPIEKFLYRLGEIRDIYQEGSQAGDAFMAVRERLASRPLLNPWREATTEDMKLAEEPGSPPTQKGANVKFDEETPTRTKPDVPHLALPGSREHPDVEVMTTSSFFTRSHRSSVDTAASGDTVARSKDSSCFDPDSVNADLDRTRQFDHSFPSSIAAKKSSLTSTASLDMDLVNSPMDNLSPIQDRGTTRNSSARSHQTQVGDQTSPRDERLEDASLKRAAEWLEKVGAAQSNVASTLRGFQASTLQNMPGIPERIPDSRKSTKERLSDCFTRGGHRTESFRSTCSDSPRVLASVNEMREKIDSFCRELQARDVQVAQLTEERERNAIVLETLIRRIGGQTAHANTEGSPSTARSDVVSPSFETLRPTHPEQADLDSSCMTCKKEDLEQMARLLENLRTQVNRLNLASPRVAMCPMIPVVSPRGGHSSRGFAWQCPTSLTPTHPVDTCSPRVITPVPVNVVAGSPSQHADGSGHSSPLRPASPIRSTERIERIFVTTTSPVNQSRARPPSPPPASPPIIVSSHPRSSAQHVGRGGSSVPQPHSGLPAPVPPQMSIPQLSGLSSFVKQHGDGISPSRSSRPASPQRSQRGHHAAGSPSRATISNDSPSSPHATPRRRSPAPSRASAPTLGVSPRKAAIPSTHSPGNGAIGPTSRPLSSSTVGNRARTPSSTSTGSHSVAMLRAAYLSQISPRRGLQPTERVQVATVRSNGASPEQHSSSNFSH